MSNSPVLILYAVRNREGKWFRSKGYGGYGETWVADVNKAKLYPKIAQARGRVTFFATSWPQYGVPDIVEFTAFESRVLPESERVRRASQKKADAKAAAEAREREWEIEAAEKQKRDAEKRLAKLRAKR